MSKGKSFPIGLLALLLSASAVCLNASVKTLYFCAGGKAISTLPSSPGLFIPVTALMVGRTFLENLQLAN